MWLLIVSCIILLNPHFSTATINYNEALNKFYQNDQCHSLGDQCQSNKDCCSHLICYFIQDTNLCLSSEKDSKRMADDLIIPPYYNPKNRLYPYGINMPPFPFYNAYKEKQFKSNHRSKMAPNLEWDHCQFHEDCGEGNCCHVHFRFRSLPKSFCRPNRNDKNELCEPLTKYRSLKDVPAWKKYQKQQRLHEKQHGSFSLSTSHTDQ